jgi:hypothetical protein
MVALLIAVGALLIAVIGCALLDPRPSTASEELDEECGRMPAQPTRGRDIARASSSIAGLAFSVGANS